MRIAILIFMALLLPVSTGATTFYVDAAAAGAANGTSWTDAWTTLTAAESGASTGDTVLVLAGTYSEAAQLTLTKGITWSVRANITDTTVGSATVTSAQETDNALLNIGQNTAKSFTGFTFDCGTIRSTLCAPLATQTQPLTFTNCTFTTGKTTGSANYAFYSADWGNTLTLTGCTFTTHDGGYWTRVVYWRAGSGAKAAPTMTMTGGTFNANATYGISYHADSAGGPTLTLSGVTVAQSAGIGIEFAAAGTLVVDGCAWTTSGATYTTAVTVGGATTASASITNNTFTLGTKSNGDFISIQSGGTKTVLVEHNTFTTSTTPGQSGKCLVRSIDQTGVRVVGNTFEISANASNAFSVVAIETSGVNTAYYAYIAGNTFRHSDTNSLSIAIGNNGATAMQTHYAVVEGNIIYGIARTSATVIDHHGILIGNCIGAQVRNNTVIGAGYGVVLKGSHDGSGGSPTMDFGFQNGVHHNLLIDSDKSGILLKGCMNVPVEHNTIYQSALPTYDSASACIGARVNGAGVETLTNRVRYNILYSVSPCAYVFMDDGDQTFESSNWNCYYGGGGWKVGATSYATIALWNAALTKTYEANSIVANPKFNVPGKDFRLGPTSPCINPGSRNRLYMGGSVLWLPQWSYGALPAVFEPLKLD